MISKYGRKMSSFVSLKRKKVLKEKLHHKVMPTEWVNEQ
jgi:hypothetical protein